MKYLLLLLLVGVALGTLDPSSIPRFQTNINISIPMYLPNGTQLHPPKSTGLTQSQVKAAVANPYLTLYISTTTAVQQQVLPAPFPKTTVYAYSGYAYDSITFDDVGIFAGWPGPAFCLPKNSKIQITWKNGMSGKHMFTIEKNLFMDSTGINFDTFIPNIAHLHGFFGYANWDGIPDAWFNYDGTHGADNSISLTNLWCLSSLTRTRRRTFTTITPWP